MSEVFSYSGNPLTSSKDEVRFLIGDTIKSRPLFSDSEILYQLTRTPNAKMAGSELLEVKARQFARLADTKVGDVSKSLSQVSKQMLECALNLRADATRSVLPFFGGLTHSGKRTLAQDEDAVQPRFSIGMSDNPAATQLNNSVSALYELYGDVI